MTVIGVFEAEWLKLRKRPAALVVVAIWLAIILLAYVLQYAFSRNTPHIPGASARVIAGQRKALTAPLLPQNIVHELVPIFSSLGGTLMLILAALIGGSEYGWATLKTILTQRPGRTRVFAGKILALLLLLVLFVTLGFAASLVGSLIVALAEHTRIVFPPVGDIIEGAAAMLLIFAAWAAVGLGLAVIFRGTTLAIGLGLVYTLVIEGLIGAFSSVSISIRTISEGLLGTNANALVDPFRTSSTFNNGAATLLKIGVAQAVGVLSIYVVVFVLAAALLFQRRDVT
jgi:ABC-2 type transport system permease protein